METEEKVDWLQPINFTALDESWRKANFSVRTIKGLTSIKGLICGSFGIHKDGNKYSLDHLPTGIRVFACSTQKQAKELAARLSVLGDWSAVRANPKTQEWLEGNELRDEAVKIVKEYKDNE